MGSKVAPRAWIPDVRFLRSCALIRLRRSEFAQRKRREAHQFRDELLSALWAPGFVDRQCSDIVVPFMRICFVVDYRSPIARNWLDFFIAGEHEVHVISTHGATAPVPRPATLHCVPMGLASLRSQPMLRRHMAMTAGREVSTDTRRLSIAGSLLRRITTELQHTYKWVAPYEARLHAGRIAKIIGRIRPDLVHAMRIPFEGILAARAMTTMKIPLLVSVWGNDFTLHAAESRPVAMATRFVMSRADALLADCERDIRLAKSWGLDARKPNLLVPGNGGIRTDLFHPGTRNEALAQRWEILPADPVVINPRNFRPSYVRNDLFFAAIPAVLKAIPNAKFLCVGMYGNPIAETWVRRFDIGHAVRLIPAMDREGMGDLFRLADVAVSPSNHDGTPNTLLEAMACGAFPVAGDIESVREWIESGRNGLLCNPNDASALAHAIITALTNRALREGARAANHAIIVERAEFNSGMRRAERFYEELVDAAARNSDGGLRVGAS